MTPAIAKAECGPEPTFYFVDESAETMLRALSDQIDAWLEKLRHIQPKATRTSAREMQALKMGLACAKSALADLSPK